MFLIYIWVAVVQSPGLVMPSFAMSKASMYLAGLLPIDRMREPLGAATLLAARIGRERLESHYMVSLVH